MGVFNIDFSQFKPSPPQPKVLPTPTVTQPISSPAPFIKSSIPVSQPQPQPVTPPADTSNGKFFSGGSLSKIFDILRIPEYAIAGFTKGEMQKNKELNTAGQSGVKNWKDILTQAPQIFKAGISNILPGIANRTTYGTGDQNANVAGEEFGIKNPVLQGATNFGLSLAAPVLPVEKVLKPIAKVGELVKGIPFVENAIGKISEFAKTTPFIYKNIEKVSPFFRVPEFGKIVQTAEENTGSRLNSLFKDLKGMIVDLKPEDQVHIGEIIEGKAVPSSSKFEKIASQVTDLSKKIGQEAVDAGLMPQKVFDDMTAKGYLSHIFIDQTKNAERYTGSVRNIPKIIGNMFKKRTGAEGYVQQFAPAVFKGLGSEVKDIETARMFKTVADQFGEKIARGADTAEGFVRASDVGIQGSAFAKAFKGLQIPTAVADYLTAVRKVNAPTLYDKIMGIWKAGKTIYNPAYHVRNEISNQILSSMSTEKNVVSTAIDYLKNLKEYRAGASDIYKAAEDAGIVGRHTFGAGLNELLNSAGLSEEKWYQKLASAPKEFQNFSEESAKFNVFKTWMQKFADDAGTTVKKALENNGLVKQAADKAQEAIFSPYRISQAERSLVGRKIPFYSFTRQALPFTVKTLVKNPKSLAVYGKLQDAIQSLSESPNIQLPDYLKNQIRLPTKDKNGNPAYFDPTYIYPFGNFVDSGLGKSQLPFGLSYDPFAMEVIQQLANKDFYFGNQIATSNLTAKAIGQRLAHLYRTAAPALLTTLTNTIYPALVAKKDSQGRTRNVGQAILSALGVKVSSPDMQNIQTQNVQTGQTKMRSIQSEIDKVLNDNNLTRAQKDEQIKQLQQLTP